MELTFKGGQGMRPPSLYFRNHRSSCNTFMSNWSPPFNWRSSGWLSLCLPCLSKAPSLLLDIALVLCFTVGSIIPSGIFWSCKEAGLELFRTGVRNGWLACDSDSALGSYLCSVGFNHGWCCKRNGDSWNTNLVTSYPALLWRLIPFCWLIIYLVLWGVLWVLS